MNRCDDRVELLDRSHRPRWERIQTGVTTRERGNEGRAGVRRRIAADFLIGAHAMTQCDRLLSRDRGFYRDYFSTLVLIDPSQQ